MGASRNKTGRTASPSPRREPGPARTVGPAGDQGRELDQADESDPKILGALKASDELQFGPDLGLRMKVARRGDSISKMIESSDPAAIGRFLRQNGMGRDSWLREGETYWTPTSGGGDAAEDEALGQSVLDRDNSRRRHGRSAPVPAPRLPASVAPSSWMSPRTGFAA